MAKKEYTEGSFGVYFVKLIKDHDYSQAKFASDLGVSKTYLFDVFNGRVKPPTPDMQDRIVELLRLTDDEKNDFYSKAADGRHELAAGRCAQWSGWCLCGFLWSGSDQT